MSLDRRMFVQTATALAVGTAGTRAAQTQTPAPTQLAETAPATVGALNALPEVFQFGDEISLVRILPPQPPVRSPSAKMYDRFVRVFAVAVRGCPRTGGF